MDLDRPILSVRFHLSTTYFWIYRCTSSSTASLSSRRSLSYGTHFSYVLISICHLHCSMRDGSGNRSFVLGRGGDPGVGASASKRGHKKLLQEEREPHGFSRHRADQDFGIAFSACGINLGLWLRGQAMVDKSSSSPKFESTEVADFWEWRTKVLLILESEWENRQKSSLAGLRFLVNTKSLQDCFFPTTFVTRLPWL